MKQAQVMPVMDSSAAARISKPTNGRQTEGERERESSCPSDGAAEGGYEREHHDYHQH